MKPKDLAKPTSIVEQVHKSLSTAILNQELKPGALLREVELQEWFGVSRAPIREAIRLLESEGLVVVNAFKKKYVRKFSRKELEETYAVLGCLETFAAYLATGNITEEQLARLDQNIKEMEEAYKNDNIEACTGLNFEFHRTVIEAAGNSVLKKSISSIMKGPGWFWLTRTYYAKPVLVLASITDHGKVVEALRSRDAEAVGKAMRAHFLNIQANWDDQMGPAEEQEQ